jgi:hypothetical protein
MKRITFLTAAVALMGLASSAQALIIGDAYYLGSVDPGTPADAPTEAAFINALLGYEQGAGPLDCTPPLGDPPGSATDYTCSRVGSSIEEDPLPVATATGAAKIEPGVTSFDVTGWAYVLAKYGNTSYIWYVGGLSGTQTLLASLGTAAGLSHVSFYNFTQVPEPGMLSLLGAGLVGVALMRRRRALKA